MGEMGCAVRSKTGDREDVALNAVENVHLRSSDVLAGAFPDNQKRPSQQS